MSLFFLQNCEQLYEYIKCSKLRISERNTARTIHQKVINFGVSNEDPMMGFFSKEKKSLVP